jgi:DNA-binding transcriptional LysR family regulator
MNLRQFRYFVAVIENGGVRKASEAVHISQPALTRQLRQLELELGVELFKRRPGSRGIEITEFGSIVLNQAKIIESAIKYTYSEIETLKGRHRTQVVVGTIGRSGSYLLPIALSRFHIAYPDVNVTIRTCPPDPVAELLSGKVDFTVGIDFGIKKHPQLNQEVLFEDSFAVIAANSSLANKKELKLDDLMDEKWVFWLGAGIPRWAIDTVLPWPGGEAPRNAIITDSPQVERSLILNDGRLGVWSLGAFPMMGETDIFTPIFRPKNGTKTPIIITWPKDRNLPSPCNRLMDSVRNVGQETAKSLKNNKLL